jgi:uncharacterized membrane protein
MSDTSATVENRKRITGFSTFRAVPMQKYINSNHGKRRSLLKAISYRVVGSSATVFISFILTRELSLSLSIGALELVGKIGLFYIHERIWDRI